MSERCILAHTAHAACLSLLLIFISHTTRCHDCPLLEECEVAALELVLLLDGAAARTSFEKSVTFARAPACAGRMVCSR